MSYKTQVALGKNSTLQRQLEGTFEEFKRNLKSSRRRLDKLEEECLSSLYKLIVDVKENKEGDGKNNGDSKTPADTRRAMSANPKLERAQSCIYGPSKKQSTPEVNKRPMTSMSVRNYKQSYSFKVDGLNIDKSRRERYIKSKKQKEEKAIEIRRGNVHWATNDFMEDRPKTAANFRVETSDIGEDSDKDGKVKRPFTADPYQSRNTKLLHQRPTMTNTLGSAPSPALFRPAASTPIAGPQRPGTATDGSGTAEQKQFVTKTDSVVLDSLDDPQTLVSMGNDMHHGRNTPQITFKVTITKLNDMRSETPNNAEQVRSQSRNDISSTEDDLLPLEDDDRQHLETIMDDNTDDDLDSVDGSRSRVPKSPRSATKSGKRSHRAIGGTPSSEEDHGVVETATRTQEFLTSYAKRSKLLGYVVKTRSSSAAPRDKAQKTYRSPSVTYQELVSIKANIRQQESRTRLLLQRSAKLAKYVDSLANAGNVRAYLSSLKQQ